MRFIYGNNDFKTMERGEENCYLMTNGLGGFSSLSMVGSCTRNDQAVLMACTHSPNHRYNMIHRLEETLQFGEKKVFLSTQDVCPHDRQEKGYLYLNCFSFDDYPEWSYHVGGVSVIRSIVLRQGKNTLGISYQIRNRSDKEVTLSVIPHMQFVPKGVRLSEKQTFTVTEREIISNGLKLCYVTNGTLETFDSRFCDTLYYKDDIADGKMSLGRTLANHRIVYQVAAGTEDTLELIYSMDEKLSGDCRVTVSDFINEVTVYRNTLKVKAGFSDEIASQLTVSADQFISYRSSTNGKTILAGYPFFEDWGRDTMIALTGLCLSTGQFETAESILRTFMAYCEKGLMPNLFPEGKEAPGYNTVDAALLFVIAVYEYYQRTGKVDFVKEAYPIMQDIISWYRIGTDFGIHMDEDGLITAGQGYDQVTWMDVRVEDILPTPRHGKPVEINAYWYNALMIMSQFQHILQREEQNDYDVLTEKVKVSFQKNFWNEEDGCLKDVISGTEADEQIRCNQIWAVSLPFSLLPREQEKLVVETVYRKLYTPYGLRTLDPDDKQFRSFYGGAQLDRDLAYHQGTVWTFPMGAYYLAYLKVNDYSDLAIDIVTEQLSVLEAALREGCIGQLPEIYDGDRPTSSKGCFAQAWSVGEILKVYDALRTHKKEK